MIATKISHGAATAVRDFITELDSEHVVSPLEASRLWVALQARCPHAVMSDDPEGGRSCDACIIEERVYGWNGDGSFITEAKRNG